VAKSRNVRSSSGVQMVCSPRSSRPALAVGGSARRATFADHKALAFGVVEHLREHCVGGVDGGQRERLAPAPPAALSQGHVELVEVGGPKVLELDLAERRQHVVLERLAVAADGRGTSPLGRQRGEPVRDVVRQGDP
jgi:hypothetical protein